MEELLKEFLKIDNKAQKIIEKVEVKDGKIDEIIEQQLNDEKQKIDQKYKMLLDTKKTELQQKYNETIVEISAAEKEKLHELSKIFNEKKYGLEEQILRNIIGRKAE